MSLIIEYGCTYNWMTETICHNSGPFTQDECKHDYSKEKELVEHIKESRKQEIKEIRQKYEECLVKFQPDFDANINRYIQENVDERLLCSKEQSTNYVLRLPPQVLDAGTYTIAFDREENVFLVRCDLAFAPKYCGWVYIY